MTGTKCTEYILTGVIAPTHPDDVKVLLAAQKLMAEGTPITAGYLASELMWEREEVERSIGWLVHLGRLAEAPCQT